MALCKEREWWRKVDQDNKRLALKLVLYQHSATSIKKN